MMKWRSGQVELEPHSTFLGFTASQPSAGAEFSDFQLSLRWGWGHPVNCPTNRGPADCVTLQVLFSRSCSSVSTAAGDGVEFAVLFWDSSIALWCLCTELCQSRKTFQLNIDMMPAGASLSTEFLEPCPQKTAAFYLARKTPSCHCCPICVDRPATQLSHYFTLSGVLVPIHVDLRSWKVTTKRQSWKVYLILSNSQQKRTQFERSLFSRQLALLNSVSWVHLRQ